MYFGYVKVYRQIMDSAVWTNSDTLKVWMWCLLRAKYEPQSWEVQGESVKIDRGQFVTGSLSAADQLRMPKSSIWRHLRKLEEWGNIVIKPGRKYSVITICNYETYQGLENEDGTPVVHKRSIGGLSVGTVKERKKERKKEERYALILNHWNGVAKQHGLASVIRLSDKRKRGVDARLREVDFDFEKIVTEIGVSDFLRGSTGWKVDFDFVFCSANNYLKILEGKYRNGGTRKSVSTNSQLARATFKHGEQEVARLNTLKETLDNRDRKRD